MLPGSRGQGTFVGLMEMQRFSVMKGLEKSIMSSYYKVSHILFIWLAEVAFLAFLVVLFCSPVDVP